MKKIISILLIALCIGGCGKKEAIEDNAPNIDWTEKMVEENLGKEIFCSLDSFAQFNEIAREKYGDLYFCGEIVEIEYEELTDNRNKPVITIADNNDERSIKVYCDSEEDYDFAIGDVVYVNGMVDFHIKHQDEYRCEDATVETKPDDNEYMTIAETTKLLDKLYSTIIKTNCYLDGQEEFYCELENAPDYNGIGILCYTDEDLREYDNQFITIEGKYFMDCYNEWGLMHAHKVEEDAN